MSARIFLIHGYLSAPEAWAPLQHELAGEAETFAPPLPGYGGREDPASYSLGGLADALEADLDRFQPNYLLGHSMGALVALELARRHGDRFRAVGLAGLPVFADLDEGRRFIGPRSRARAIYLSNPAGGHRWCEPIHRLRRLWGPVLALTMQGHPRAMLDATFDHSAAAHLRGLEEVVFAGHAPALAAQVRTPVALLHGDVDGVAPLAPAAALARERGWPLRIAHGADHSLIFACARGTARWVRFFTAGRATDQAPFSQQVSQPSESHAAGRSQHASQPAS